MPRRPSLRSAIMSSVWSMTPLPSWSISLKVASMSVTRLRICAATFFCCQSFMGGVSGRFICRPMEAGLMNLPTLLLNST